MPDEEAHLCPVRAMGNWIRLSRVTSGYVFRKIASGGRVSQQNTAMVHVFFSMGDLIINSLSN